MRHEGNSDEVALFQFQPDSGSGTPIKTSVGIGREKCDRDDAITRTVELTLDVEQK